jgi:hypothetical protein
MAAVQERNGSFRILFHYLAKQYTFTLGEVARDEVETKAAQVDYLLLRIKQDFVQLPPGVSITEFVEKDSQVKTPEKPVAALAPVTLAQLKDRYLETYGNGDTCRIERAKDILMKELGLSEADAFRRLQKTASAKNLKLIELARLTLAVSKPAPSS